ncbi:MAG: peptide chain release factor N(5)-glutamine methyltransferase, partial [Alphaproteobacteria bacterium]
MDTLSKAVQVATRDLQIAGVDQPRRDARLLVAQAIGGDIARTIADSERPLTAAEQAGLDALVAQRAARRPMSQIAGTREFWSLDFKVSEDVLTPRSDSETLVEAVLGARTQRTAPLRLLDLGTGSGCLLLALLSELPAAYGIGVDVSVPAVTMARSNARALGLSARATFVVGDWSNALSGSFDIVISNPPYIPAGDIDALMPEVARYEPRGALAGGQDGHDAYRAIFPTL